MGIDLFNAAPNTRAERAVGLTPHARKRFRSPRTKTTGDKRNFLPSRDHATTVVVFRLLYRTLGVL